MSDSSAHAELIARLRSLAPALDVEPDDARLVDAVLARVAGHDAPSEPAATRGDRAMWLVAAVVIALACGFVAWPSGRAAVARWLGLDGVTIEVDPTLPASPPGTAPTLPGPGETEVLTVDGREVIVSAIDGRLFEEAVTKMVQSSEQISEVRVAGHPGLWIAGAAHQVAYEAGDRDVRIARVAANTLLWQDGEVLFRVEGFDDLADALEFASAG